MDAFHNQFKNTCTKQVDPLLLLKKSKANAKQKRRLQFSFPWIKQVNVSSGRLCDVWTRKTRPGFVCCSNVLTGYSTICSTASGFQGRRGGPDLSSITGSKREKRGQRGQLAQQTEVFSKSALSKCTTQRVNSQEQGEKKSEAKINI